MLSILQKTEAEVDEVLNKSVALFRFLTEKDAFEKYYNSHLSKRLIGGRSVSDDAERSMLAKFKIEAGAAFTKSAEGMMKDCKVSEDTRDEFTRFLQRSSTVRISPSLFRRRCCADPQPLLQTAPFDMQPIICGSNFWPFSAKDASCTLPKVLQDGINSFETFYNQKHSGRKLSFRPEFGSVDVKVKFKARSHELNVSTHAMVVLALFEGLGEEETLSYVVRLSLSSSFLPLLQL
jgi:cullin 3